MTVYGPAVDGAPDAALALRVTDTGVEQIGTVSQPRSGVAQRGGGSGIRRSLVIGSTLWTVSDNGLQASDLATLHQVGWVPNG
jgi:hypothetical protein